MTIRNAVLLSILVFLGLSPAGHSGHTRHIAKSSSPGVESLSPGLEAVLDRLEAEMKTVKTLSADFTQIKKLAAFAQALEITGRLYLERPERFAWHVLKPIRYRMVIKEGMLYQWDKISGRVQKLSLVDNPEFTAISRQMESWFSGNYKQLLNNYQAVLLDENPLRLRFTPRKNVLAGDFIREVTVTFQADERYIQTLELVETSGDRTIIRFSATRINPVIEDSAWKVKGEDH